MSKKKSKKVQQESASKKLADMASKVFFVLVVGAIVYLVTSC